jgi:hypothetical protein
MTPEEQAAYDTALYEWTHRNLKDEFWFNGKRYGFWKETRTPRNRFPYRTIAQYLLTVGPDELYLWLCVMTDSGWKALQRARLNDDESQVREYLKWCLERGLK